jgi:hypothetical protein
VRHLRDTRGFAGGGAHLSEELQDDPETEDQQGGHRGDPSAHEDAHAISRELDHIGPSTPAIAPEAPRLGTTPSGL